MPINALFKPMVLVCLLMLSCKKFSAPAPNPNDLLDGPLEELRSDEMQQFLAGDDAFNNQVFTVETGLGPLFVSTSCGSCHAGDGKGHPFTSLMRFGQYDSSGNHFLNHGGPQLQNRAIPGYAPEQIPNEAVRTKILPPANTGLGYLDALSDADILAGADPLDANGDGISGRVNWVSVPAYCALRPNSITNNGKYIGRFGRKGAAYDLLQQTANAYNQDMGISSNFEPIDTYSKLPVDAEVTNVTVQQVVFYLKTLKAPIPRNQNNTQIIAGKQTFFTIGCETCHRSQLHSSESNIAALSKKAFSPYTDMLLHDMGALLNDGYTEGSASSAEWKTPALWGLGLSKNSQGGTFYLMHDGRAQSIEAAILLHSGEGQKSKENYQSLNAEQQKNLVLFLESL